MPTKLRLLAPILCLLMTLGGCTSIAEHATRFAIQVERQRADLVRKEIDLPDGQHVAYLEGGQGETLLLLHGFGGNKDNFTRVARLLTPHYRVIVPDLTGFGESGHPAGADYRAQAQVQRLDTLMHALGVRRLHIGGNSMGGYIALTYAAEHRLDVASLWLLDPAGIMQDTKSELAQIITTKGENPLLIHNEDEFARMFDFVMSDPPYVPRAMLDVMARERINNFAMEQQIFKQTVTDPINARVNGLTTPTLIVWGAKDRLIHVATAEVLHKMMPRSQVIIMPDVGHVPMVERPAQSAQDYLRFRAALTPQ